MATWRHDICEQFSDQAYLWCPAACEALIKGSLSEEVHLDQRGTSGICRLADCTVGAAHVCNHAHCHADSEVCLSVLMTQHHVSMRKACQPIDIDCTGRGLTGCQPCEWCSSIKQHWEAPMLMIEVSVCKAALACKILLALSAFRGLSQFWLWCKQGLYNRHNGHDQQQEQQILHN